MYIDSMAKRKQAPAKRRARRSGDSDILYVRISPDDKATLRQQADAARMSLSMFVRHKLLAPANLVAA